jgi:hypothetical protein
LGVCRIKLSVFLKDATVNLQNPVAAADAAASSSNQSKHKKALSKKNFLNILLNLTKPHNSSKVPKQFTCNP